jgi:hypothetical protein
MPEIYFNHWSQQLRHSTFECMAMGKRKHSAHQSTIWIATSDLPTTAAHPFYERINQILDQASQGKVLITAIAQRLFSSRRRAHGALLPLPSSVPHRAIEQPAKLFV